MASGQSGQLLGSLSSDDDLVSAVTTLRFDLQSTGTTAAQGDYLEIAMPSDHGGYFEYNSGGSCHVDNASIQACNFIDGKTLRIVFSYRMSTTAIRGYVTSFVNPPSTRGMSSVRITLYSSIGQARLTTFFGSLTNIRSAGLQADLSTTSKTIGDKASTLLISIQPDTVMTASGRVVLNMPQYYENSGTDQMVSSSSPACSADQATVTSCFFNVATKVLTINYQMRDGLEKRNRQRFEVRQFKNPVSSNPKSGFTLQTTDAQGFIIATSNELTLSGVTLPSDFQDVSFSFIDNTIVGRYSQFRVQVSMRSSLGPSCFVRIIFPQEFGLDNNLQTVSGTGFMQSQYSSSINLFEKNLYGRSFAFEACRSSWGLDPVGTATFIKVKNPLYIMETGSFTVQIASDASFTDMIAQRSSGLTVKPQQLQGGLIEDIQVRPLNAFVNQATSYAFSFTPVSSIDARTESKIEITIPTTLKFENTYCRVDDRSSHLSSSMSCNLENGNTIVLAYAFSNRDFQGGTPIFVTISSIINASYAGDVGGFTIKTMIKRSGSWFVQDEATKFGLVILKSGKIDKVSDIIANSYVANKVNVQYTFDMRCQHTVPLYGLIRITLPKDMSMRDDQVTNNCFRTGDYSSNPVRLDCRANSFSNEVDVLISGNAFGYSGLEGGTRFTVQIGGLTNPKEIRATSMFKIQSFDENEQVIDTAPDSAGFTITMLSVGSLGSITVKPESLVNGETTTYNFEIVPELEISRGDKFYMLFPPEISLPMSYYINCRGDYQISLSSCVKSNDRELAITFRQVSGNYKSWQPFNIYVDNVVNPVSFKPSAPFSGMRLVSSFNFEIATYSNPRMIVTTNQMADIKDFTFKQTEMGAGEESHFVVTMQPGSRLPHTAAIKIEAPREIEIVRADYDDCYIETQRKVKGQCLYEGQHTLVIRRGLAYFRGGFYYGDVKIVFKARNPQSNFYQGVQFKLEISLDDTFKYPIAMLDGGLAPSFECNYPCISCNPNDPDDCESCPEGRNAKQFLQADRYTGKKTCKTQCDLGYTFDRKVSTTCLPCDPSCATCRQGGYEEDRRMCNSCAPGYPFLWIDEARCFARNLGCPQGTYEYTKNRCRACTQYCQICTSASNCLRCDVQSDFPLLQNDGCVDRCQLGKSPIFKNGYGQCVNCGPDCATCEEGSPNYCLTCADGEKQFLFGGQCLAACPEGTTRDLETSRCIGCRQGCKECDLKDNSICIRCDDGLSLYKKQCLTECPIDYKKSVDGTVCEPRTYPFDSTFVPFPFTIMLGSLYFIGIFCWILTKKKALLLQIFIIFSAFVLQLAVIFELLKSMAEGQALFITMTMLLLIANTLLSLAFSVTFHLQIDDHQFNEWREKNAKAYRTQRLLFTFFSLHFFRLIYGKMFNLKAFQASATVPHEFVKPIRLYSKLHILIVQLPIFALNVYGVLVTYEGEMWDNQLQMTMFETLIIVIMLSSFTFIEMYRTDPRALLHKPTDESPFFVDLFKGGHSASGTIEDDVDSAKGGLKRKGKKRRGQKVALSTVDEDDKPSQRGFSLERGRSYWEITDIKIRHSQLFDIIRTIKSYADLNLNNQLDLLIDQRVQFDVANVQWEAESCPDLDHSQNQCKPDDDWNDHNTSFPGLNQNFDEQEKRFQLLDWFNRMAEEDAERERIQQQAMLKVRMAVDAACMHDTELIDNCFFSSRAKVTAQAQTVALHVVERAISIMTPFSKSSLFGKKGPKTQKSDSIDLNIVSHKVRGNAQLDSYYDDQTPRDFMNSDRELLPEGNRGRKADLIGTDGKNASGEDMIADVLREIDSDKGHIRYLQRERGLNTYDGDGQEYEYYKSPVRPKDPNCRDTPKAKHKRHKKRVGEESDTISKGSRDHRLGLEEQKERESFMDDVIYQDHEGSESEAVSVHSTVTVSTARRGPTREKRIIMEKRPDLSIFREEPVRPANSRKWLLNASRMVTIALDEGVRAEMVEPCGDGMVLKENVGCSEPSTEKTIEKQDSLHVSEKDRINGGLSEESYAEDDALFYRNNYPYDTHESISSVHTEDLDPVEKIEMRQDFTAWMRESLVINQRTFNVNEVIGNFPRDQNGRIKNRAKIIRERHYRDFDGQLVNECGYLINEVSGALRSKYTYEDLMIGEYGNLNEVGELPMPYRIEQHNFNPHRITGSFEYDQKGRMTFFRNKFGGLTDKLFRPVNGQGYLINEREDIIDDEGRVRFVEEQTGPNGGLQPLYTYKAEQFKITDIIGQFLKDDKSKEIILNTDPVTGKTVDMKGRLVNATGYLIDDAGNIVKYGTKGERKIMFNFWEIMYQEPPKIFKFTEFDIRWIKGRLDRDVTQNPRHDDEYDLDGRLINSLGYLIDVTGNIVDYHDKMVFRKEILINAYGQDAKIPAVFTKRDLLLKPLGCDEPYSTDRERILHPNQVQFDKETKRGDKMGNSTNNNMSGAGPNDTTNVGSATNVNIDASKSGNQSGVFSESGVPHQTSTQHSHNSAGKEKQTPDNRDRMQIEELQTNNETEVILNIGKSVGTTQGKKIPFSDAFKADGTSQKQPKKKQQKKKHKRTPNAPQYDITPQRLGDKIMQNMYPNYIDASIGPDEQSEPIMKLRKPPQPRYRSKEKPARPSRSAARNQRGTIQSSAPSTRRLVSPQSQQDLKLQQVQFQGYVGGNDYANQAEQVFNQSNKQAKQMTQQMLRDQDQSAHGRNLNMSLTSNGLNQSGAALLNNQFAQASNAYQPQRQLFK